jgi:hypothetical protein
MIVCKGEIYLCLGIVWPVCRYYICTITKLFKNKLYEKRKHLQRTIC